MIKLLLVSSMILVCTIAHAGIKEGIDIYNNGDYSTALNVFRIEAENGSAEAQYYMAALLSCGDRIQDGIQHDSVASLAWLKKSAAQNYAPALYKMGQLLIIGDHPTQDYVEAVGYFQKSAELGDDQAQYSLGQLYELGMGTSRDFVKTVRWYRASAAQGNVHAQHELALRLAETGENGTPNYTEAIQWMEKAVLVYKGDGAKLDIMRQLQAMHYQGRTFIRDCCKSAYFEQFTDYGMRDAKEVLGIEEKPQPSKKPSKKSGVVNAPQFS